MTNNPKTNQQYECAVITVQNVSELLNISLSKDIVESYYEPHCAEGGWRARTASGSRGIIEHYIYPFIGDEPIENVSTYYIQQYYADLLTHDAVKQKDGQTVKISPRMVRDVKKILNPAFRYAIQMGLREDNPVTDAKLPRESKKSYQQWDAEEALEALQNCDDFELMQSVVFRSLRNTGATTQMQVSGNDIKAVQANMGYATADMLMEHYLAADDDRRRGLALQMENEVFSKLDLSAYGLEAPKKKTGKKTRQKRREETGSDGKN